MGTQHQFLCSSVWREGSEREQCCCVASGGLPGTLPISSHFTHSMCVTGTLVVSPRVSGFVYVLRPCGPFKRILLKIQQFLMLPQLPLVFTTRSHGDLFSWHWNTGLCSLAWSWDCWLPRYPSQFLPTTCECGTTSSAPLLPLCAALHPLVSLPVSTPPTHLDECGFKSLVVRLPYSLIF